jgi:hypothetical protein
MVPVGATVQPVWVTLPGMLAIAIALALVATPLRQERVPELTLGSRTGAIAEPFSDAMGLAELRDGDAVVSDRIERVYTRVNFSTGQRTGDRSQRNRAE